MKSHSLLITFLLCISIHLFSTGIGYTQDETVLRSFDIKLGENEDKSLYDYSSNFFGDYYISFNPKSATRWILLKKPIFINNGFEMKVTFSSEEKISTSDDFNFRIEMTANPTLPNGMRTFDFSNSLTEGKDVFSSQFLSKSMDQTNEYDKLNIKIYDGKKHELNLKYIPISSTKVKRILIIDGKNRFEKIFDGIINANFPSGMGNAALQWSAYFRDGRKESLLRIYNWSFKSL